MRLRVHSTCERSNLKITQTRKQLKPKHARIEQPRSNCDLLQSAFDISTKMKARVHVITARGHGPNSLFPHEVAWLELWSVKNANHKIETSKRPAVASKPLWDEIIELEIGKDEKEIVMKMRGKLPSHDAVDEIGSGTYHIENIETGAADKHSVNVPIYASNGKEAGEIDLEIEIEL